MYVYRKFNHRKNKSVEINFKHLMIFKNCWEKLAMAPLIGLTTQEQINLFQNLKGDKNLNSPRKVSTETEKELALVEKKFQKHMWTAWIQSLSVF